MAAAAVTREKARWTLALAVRCPICFAPKRQKCVSKETGKPKRWPHPARVTAYNKTQEGNGLASSSISPERVGSHL